MSSIASCYPPRYTGGGHRHGQIIPHRLCSFTWLKQPDKLAQFILGPFDTVVPPDFWVADALEDGTGVADISCPCGGTPQVPHLNFMVCPGEECDRIYWNLGDSVRVARLGPEDLPQSDG